MVERGHTASHSSSLRCWVSEQGGENQKLQGPPQLPDSPDLFGYWLSQGSAGVLRVVGKAI